jgi:hypothetical protein
MSRSRVTLLYLVATTGSAVALPFLAGRAIGRWGTRIVAVVISTGLGAACFVVSLQNHGPTFSSLSTCCVSLGRVL